MSAAPGNGNVLGYRVEQLEADVAAVRATAETLAGKVGNHDLQINGEQGLIKALREVRDEIKALKRAGWTIAGSVIAGALLVVLESAGKL